MSPRPLHGVLGTFDRLDRLIAAIRTARGDGWSHLDAFLPADVEEVTEALGTGSTAVPWVTLAGGICGALFGYLLPFYTSVVGYPWNVGGRPNHSWPAFVPIAFEMTVLFAALFGFVGMLAMNGLPCHHHPLFAVDRFQLDRTDRFFLCLEAADARFDATGARALLEASGAIAVDEVPA